jgi:WhiB family transcriptional regulator, redox-sensing transcriptional regulator
MTFGVLPALRWQRDAACLDHPGEWWFPDKHRKDGSLAKRVCAGCPVRVECLTYALGGNEDHGIWGGFNCHEIDDLKRIRCRRCGQRIPAAQAARLAIRNADPRSWHCRPCYYRSIAERRRT